MTKRYLIMGLMCIIVMFSACTQAVSLPESTNAQTLTPAPAASSTIQPTPVRTTMPEESAAPLKGTITVRGGDTLERDIIPQLCDIFSLSEEQAKDELSKAQCPLINDELTDFRRMEGIIVPGCYDVKSETLNEYMSIWIDNARQRFDKLLVLCDDTNELKAFDQLTLASIVDWECIGDEFQTETAAVFLNRLADNSKLQSCATVEYALGYQRPYLKLEDIEIDSVYNTYQTRGLPPGPICAVDEKSLFAAIGKSVDKSLYFFFYDYSSETMTFFSDYSAFKEEAKISKQMYTETFDFGKYDKIDKRIVFTQ